MTYTRSQLVDLVQHTAAQYGIDPGIAVAQVQAESNFNPNAVSPAGAQGLFQFMPGTWAQWGNGSPFNPDDAAPAWGTYFSSILRKFGGNYGYALAGYNWGENRTALVNGYNAGRDVFSLNLPAETRNYLTKILGASYAPQTGADAASNESPSETPTGSGYFLPITIGALLLFFILTGDD